MTTVAWLALAAAVSLSGAPAAAAQRVGVLAGEGRLAGGANRRMGPTAPRLPWPALAAAFGGVAVAGVAVAGGPLLGVAAAAVCGVVATVARDRVRRAAAATRRAQLLAALRVLIGELDAGARPAAALAAAADAGPHYAAVFHAAATSAAAAHDAGTVLAEDPDTRVIGLAWRLGEDTGVALAGVLSRVAADLAAADEQRRTVAVALSGPRSSAFVLTGLPLVGIALGAAMGARPWDFLIGAPAGRAVCCVGVVLDVAGVAWMRHILRRAERS
jgi:tight adherence protein B